MASSPREDGQNSPLREHSGRLAPVARWLHDSGITANGITLSGWGLTVIGSVSAYLVNTGRVDFPKIIPALTSVAGGGADLLDGLVARETPDRTDTEKLNGKLLDTACDRLGAIVSALFRAKTAHYREDRVGEGLALLNAVVLNGPGLARALVEKSGREVTELDLGSHPVRWGLGLVATHFPAVGGLPVQPALDALSSALSITTTASRLAAIAKGRGQPVSETTQKEAGTKLNVLAATTGLALLAGGAYLLLTDRKRL